jgi:hypothetical protein
VQASVAQKHLDTLAYGEVILDNDHRDLFLFMRELLLEPQQL